MCPDNLMKVKNKIEPALKEDILNNIATLTLNRPDARNSLSINLLSSLEKAISNLKKNKSVKVIIINANGPSFCAGHDLKELSEARTEKDNGRKFFKKTMDSCSKLMKDIVSCPKPIICSVQGIASAAGCQLVASCDLAIASEKAMFATPGVNIGLFCSTPMVALSRNINRKHSMEMLLTGEMIAGEKAVSWGLINKCVPHGKLHEETKVLASKIASKPTSTVKIGKVAFYNQLEMTLDKAYEYTADVMVKNMLDKDSKEGIGAFLEKRSPKWKD